MRLRLVGLMRDFTWQQRECHIRTDVKIGIFLPMTLSSFGFWRVDTYEIEEVDVENYAFLQTIVTIIMETDPDISLHKEKGRFDIVFYNTDEINISPGCFMWMTTLPEHIRIKFYMGPSDTADHVKEISVRLERQKILFAGRVEEKLEAIFVDGQ